MTNLNLNAATLAAGLLIGAPSIAAELTAAEYAAAETTISTNFANEKAACASVTGNAGEICLVVAKGNETIAKADLELKNDPTPETRLQALIARAEAGFAEAKERCADMDVNSRETCLQTAQTAEEAAKAKAIKENEMELAMTNAPTATQSTTTPGENDLRATDTLFDFDSAVIRPEGHNSLDEFVGKLKADSSAQVAVVAYADRLGSAAYNQRLSEERMDVVKSYLIDKGIQTSRISATAMGQAQPTVSASDCAGERSTEVIACLQPDRRVVVSTTALVSSK